MAATAAGVCALCTFGALGYHRAISLGQAVGHGSRMRAGPTTADFLSWTEFQPIGLESYSNSFSNRFEPAADFKICTNLNSCSKIANEVLLGRLQYSEVVKNMKNMHCMEIIVVISKAC
jgi:hypothetical protein